MPGTPSTAGQHNTVGGIPGGHLLVAQAGSCRQETRKRQLSPAADWLGWLPRAGLP